MFINFWYPVCQSSALTDKPLKRKMLGLDFVVFRDSAGQAHCLSNTCVHRGGSLGDGKIKGDCIQCPYHGWEFTGDGDCQKIPSLGRNAKIPARARVDAYPVEERYGLVFAFLGDLPEQERPPILLISEYGEQGPIEGWTSTIQEFEWAFDYKRSMENGIDPAHNEFVHPTHGFSGSRDDYHIKPPKLIHTEWGTGFWSSRLAPPLAEKKMKAASGRTEDAVVHGGTGHIGVNMIWTYIHPTPEVSIHQYLFECPIDDSNTRLFLVNLRNFLIDKQDDERMMTRNQVVAMQDRDVLTEVRPIVTPETRTHELLVADDCPVVAYRDKLKEWEARGWRIDVEEMQRLEKKVAFAIPSPARRNSKGWILDAVPMIRSEPASALRAENSQAAG